MSGGRSTVALRSGDKLGAQAGDISSVHRLGHIFVERFMVECKAYRTLNFEGLIKGKGHLIDFWKIAIREANNYDKLPLLIGKQNNHPIIVCVNREGLEALNLRSQFKVLVADADLNIVLWDDFIKTSSKRSRRVRL